MQAYHTDNGALAVALTLGGVEPLRNAQGKAIPVYNIYNRDTLARLGYKGWNLEEAALHALEHGKPGVLIYNFKRCDNCDRMVDAWGRHEKTIAGLDAGAEAYTVKAGEIPVSPEDLARILCQYAKNRKSLMNVWKMSSPLISITGETTKEDKGDRIISVGSLKCYSLNLNESARKHIGVGRGR